MDEPKEPKYEQLAVLPEAVDLRDAHRQQKLGELSVGAGVALRGTRSAGHFEAGEAPVPPALDQESLDTIESWLRGRKMALKDRFTRGYNPEATSDVVGRYALGPPVKETIKDKSPEEREEFKARMRRRTHHIADQLQRESWHRMWIADERREALSHVVRAVKYGFDPLPEALVPAFDAIVNFGLCLNDEKNKQITPDRADEIDLIIENVGAYLAQYPEKAAEYLKVVEIVKIEQDHRYKEYAKRFHTTKKQGGDRLTKTDKARGQELQRNIRALKRFQKATS